MKKRKAGRSNAQWQRPGGSIAPKNREAGRGKGGGWRGRNNQKEGKPLANCTDQLLPGSLRGGKKGEPFWKTYLLTETATNLDLTVLSGGFKKVPRTQRCRRKSKKRQKIPLNPKNL